MFDRITKNRLKEFARIQDKSYRRETGLFMIEGVHAVEEFLKSDFTADWIAIDTQFEDSYRSLSGILRTRFPSIVWVVSKVEFKRLSQTEHSQGIVAAIQKRHPPYSPVESPLLLALDGLSDPGNLGTLLRSADWFGVQTVWLSHSCVELYNPKVVRATMGSIFRLNAFEDVHLEQALSDIKGRGYRIIGASADPTASFAPYPTARPAVLVIGSESHGLSPSIQSICDDMIRIPKRGHGDSLNAAVAGSVLLYEFTRP